MNRSTPRSLSAWLLPAALFAILASTGCGSSASPDANAGATPPDTAVPASAAAAQPTDAEERQRLEQQVHDLQAQLERREETAPTRKPSLPPPPRPRPAAAPTAFEAEMPQPPPAARPEAEAVHLRLEPGTELHLSLRDALSSETSQPGDPVVAVLTEDVVANGVVALPSGSEVQGSVAEVVAQKKIGGQARIALHFDKVRMPDGYVVGIESTAELLGKKQTKKDAATIGGSAAGGALLGRILSKDDKTKGTVIGAAVGAAVGTAVASKNAGDPVELEAGSSVTASLSLPVHVTVAQN